ncbi:hypothetical protein ACM90X_08940 [Enterobacter hormaechei]
MISVICAMLVMVFSSSDDREMISLLMTIMSAIEWGLELILVALMIYKAL